jgi:aspartate/methionine/tyrosine aminotransferase
LNELESVIAGSPALCSYVRIIEAIASHIVFADGRIYNHSKGGTKTRESVLKFVVEDNGLVSKLDLECIHLVGTDDVSSLIVTSTLNVAGIGAS